MKVKVKAEWMKSCGYPAQDIELEVLWTYPRTLPDGTHMYQVSFQGRGWTVAEWRCYGPAY